MSSVCEICNKKPSFGMSLSHSHRRNKRRWNPNIQRVRAVVALFGEVPRKVFTGAQAPRHTRRRVKLSEAELRLLEQASLTAAEDSPQADTELL